MWLVVLTFCVAQSNLGLAQADHLATGQPRGQPIHPFIKQMYRKTAHENGSLIADNLADSLGDSVTIWSFLDVGNKLTTATVYLYI